MVSPVQLEPSQTLLENPKQVRLPLTYTPEPLTTPPTFKANNSVGLYCFCLEVFSTAIFIH